MPHTFISVQEASQIVIAQAESIRPQTEFVSFQASLGRILAEDIYADRAFPPFNRVAMDGIAVHSKDWQNGQRTFRKVGIQAAGAPIVEAGGTGTCMEVMTGAVLPKGYDAVVPYEFVKLGEGDAEAEEYGVKAWKNIHLKGHDRKKGDTVLYAGKRIGAADIGVIATVGKDAVEVLKSLKTSIISTGDELVPVHNDPEPHQIRRSNVFSLEALLSPLTNRLDTLHLNDNREELSSRLSELIISEDVLILSGGVSMGKFDFIPDVLRELGVAVSFYKVRQRPGKPFWFGVHSSGTVVFALPGNPVSSYMCMLQYVLPFYRAVAKQKLKKQYAILDEAVHFPKEMTYFLQVETYVDAQARLHATPTRGKGSGDLAGLTEADGFLVLPADQAAFERGEIFEFIYAD